jgi:hypothetical protein
LALKLAGHRVVESCMLANVHPSRWCFYKLVFTQPLKAKLKVVLYRVRNIA